MKMRLSSGQRQAISLIILLILTIVWSLQLVYSTQLTFLLDLDNLVFTYEDNALNNTNTSEDLIFSGIENKTVWISIPKNSTIIDSSITLIGEITPSQTTGTGVAYYSVAAGNITGSSKNDIVIGAATSPQVYLFNSSLNQIWNYSTGTTGIVRSITVGNVNGNSVDDVVFGSEDKKVYLLNSTGDEIWNYTTAGQVWGVSIGNISSESGNEVVAGSDKVYSINSTGSFKWSYSGSGTIYSVVVGDVTSDPYDEVVAGDNTRVYLLNATGSEIWNYSLGPGNIVYGLDIGQISSDSGKEIVAGIDNGTVYVFNSTGSIKWYYDLPTGGTIYSISIGDMTSDSGNEIAIGSGDNKVYVINSTGSFVWSYTTGDEVHGVDIGEIAEDPLNETVVVSIDRNVYILNFDYYPTNVSLDVGNDGDEDWSYSGKLRQSLTVTNASIGSEINDYLSSCSSQLCDVPFVFHSEYMGDLNISDINMTYDYNASEAISYQSLSNTWSRTNNTLVNESIGYEVKNISYSNPAKSITVSYVKINDTATKCDFGGISYSNTSIDGTNTCDVTNYTISVGSLPSPHLLWDNTMGTSIQVYLNESSPTTNATGVWIKNITIWTSTDDTFYNVTANTTLDDNVVTSDETFNVYWNGSWRDITPSGNQTDCNTTSPTYTINTIGSDDFFVCKQDTNENDIIDFFKWKQPHTSTTQYQVTGSTNFPPDLFNPSVTPSSAIWNSSFNFTVDVNDTEGNNVTVKLWLYFENLGSWELIQTKNITTNGTAWFYVTSNKSWAGNDQYKFEYNDFNDTTKTYLHVWQNTSVYNFTVSKHSVEILYITGNNTQVQRNGTNSIEFIIRVNDTDNATIVGTSVNCSFWITTDTSNFILVNSTITNSTGHCKYTFNPNSSFSVGQQWWKGGVYQDIYYQSTNSTNYTVEVDGLLNINLTSSMFNANFTRGNDVNFQARLYDENSNPVQVQGYNCTWYLNNTQMVNSMTNSNGYCNYTWPTICSTKLAVYPLNVTLWGSVSNYYTINTNESYTNITLKDNFNISIISPTNETIYHEQENVTLNSTISDGCGSPTESYTVGWYLYKEDPSDICPPSNPVITGDNTTYTLIATCTPREQVVIVNTTGTLYNSDQENVTIFIYGWADINITEPISGQYLNRTLGVDNWVNITCYVKDNITTAGVESYPVNFWDSDTLIGSNTTNSTGYAKFRWNISSNSTVSVGNHTIKCNITDNSTIYYNTSTAESSIWTIIRDVDIDPPFFTGVYANSVEPYNNVILEVNVTDWYGVDKVWTIITYPNTTTNETYYLQNISENVLSGTWRTTLVNVTGIGDYDYEVYANDTSNQTNSTTGWFGVYNTLRFIGNATDVNNQNITLNFTFYKPGTNKIIDLNETSISGGEYNFSVFKRNTDIKIQVSNHTVWFYNVNITASAEEQFNITNTTNITNPITFDIIPLAEILLQSTTKNKMVALAVDNVFSYDNVSVTINFTSALNIYSDLSKPALRIYKCSSWQLDNRTGCDGSWEMLTTSLNSTTNTVSVNVTSMSAYVVAEYCPSCGGGGDGNGGTGGGGGGGGGLLATCGNGICETGENVDNCPQDCGKAERAPFSIKTNLTDVQIEPGKKEIYGLWIKNTANRDINVSILVGGSIFHLINLEENFVNISIDEEIFIPIYVDISRETDPAVYTGEIIARGEGHTQRLPVSITVPFSGTIYLDVVVESLTRRVNPNGTAIFHVLIYNLGFRKKINITVTYIAKELETGNIIHQEEENITLEASLPLIKNVHIPEDATLGDYSYEVEIKFLGQKISSADSFMIVKPFWTPGRVRFVLILIILISTTLIGYYVRKLYIEWRKAKIRYIFPVDMKKLPKGKIWIGKIAETDQKAQFDMNELRTHILTAGATGSGKSVSAMIFVEELLKQKIPIVAFDPTAQWTGFVRPCKDPNLFKYYSRFGFNIRDAKPYKGMIYEVTDPKVKIDFKKYMNPGEITVFTLNKLKPGQYDEAVQNIIDTIFAQGWEESTELKMVVVFDEVHRLLEKYGGKGGYVALERACREFRKWGIGLIMISQVLSDFKEAIKGNVLTEVQLHTKSLGDLKRIETKYGVDYAKRVTKQEVGIGMVQNPRYNDGKPYFVAFRPTLHSPHKIPDKELEMYKEYDKMLQEIESKIEKLEKAGKDVFGLKVELKLAKEKLKKGRFRMAKIYIDSLNKTLSR